MGLRFMDNDKNDAYYLERIKTDLEFVICHTEGKTREEIENNDLLIDSIMFRIIQIAENNNKLSNLFKSEHEEVPCVAIRGMRNRIVHAYGHVDMSFVYDTVAHGIPEMYSRIKEL